MNDANATHDSSSEGSAQPARRRRRTLLLLHAAVFLAGAAIGASATVLLITGRYHLHPKIKGPPHIWIARELRTNLELTEEQGRKVDAVLARHDQHVHDMRLQLDRLMTQLEDDLVALFPPEKARKCRAFFADMRRRHGPPPGPPPPGPPPPPHGHRCD